jgi:ABC-type multidrug transport system ATPase subunit
MNSGSGKTTLLNALNFRISSNLRVEGEIMINGASVDSNKMSLLSCYIQQDDLFFGTLTVREHLEFHVIFLLLM